MNGFSILLPTYNMLTYLKLCLQSLEKCSMLENEICITVDGSNDGTTEYLEENGYKYKFKEHEGAYSSWNSCAEMATKDHVLLSEDDFYYLPNWDVNLAKWIKELPDNYVVAHQIVEPFKGSYLHHDCGDGPAGKPFDEEKAIEYIKSVSEHTLKQQVFSIFAVNRKDWKVIKGYDENYDPYASGTCDLQMKLHALKKRRWVIANDSFVYHFKPQIRLFPHVLGNGNVEKIAKRNTERFINKWGMTMHDAFNVMGEINAF